MDSDFVLIMATTIVVVGGVSSEKGKEKRNSGSISDNVSCI